RHERAALVRVVAGGAGELRADRRALGDDTGRRSGLVLAPLGEGGPAGGPKVERPAAGGPPLGGPPAGPWRVAARGAFPPPLCVFGVFRRVGRGLGRRVLGRRVGLDVDGNVRGVVRSVATNVAPRVGRNGRVARVGAGVGGPVRGRDVIAVGRIVGRELRQPM